MVRRWVAALLVMTLAASCTPIALPPPAVPEQVMPPVAALAAPPAPSAGEVTIDADEPSQVERIAGYTSGTMDDGTGNYIPYTEPIYHTVCAATPCVTSLEFGDHDLRITSLADPDHRYGNGSITIGPQPTDYRYALGHNNIEPHFASGLVTALSGFGAFFAGSFIFAFNSTPTDLVGSPWAKVGLGSLIVGAVVTLLGVHLMTDGGTSQDGTGVQWTP